MIRKLLLAAACVGLFACAIHGQYDRPGFVTEVKDGRLWVFKPDSKELAEYRKSGEVAKQFTEIGGGPEGMTVKAGDAATLKEYLEAFKK
jgi:hypothetical protein